MGVPGRAVALVNNGGDIGRALKELGGSVSLGGKNLDEIHTADGFVANVGKNVVTDVASAAMTSAVTGVPLEDSLRTASLGAVVNAGVAQTANAIGDFTVPAPTTG